MMPRTGRRESERESSPSQEHHATADPVDKVLTGDLYLLLLVRVVGLHLGTGAPRRVAAERVEDQLQIRRLEFEAAVLHGQAVELSHSQAALGSAECHRVLLVALLNLSHRGQLVASLVQLGALHDADHDEGEPNDDGEEAEHDSEEEQKVVGQIVPHLHEEAGAQEDEGDALACDSRHKLDVLPDVHPEVHDQLDGLEERGVEHSK
mmetsp:Transcript_84902/g.218714  ORF Transcript_84902/g.218714 Transcript_84902/m.218714 type:complete len:207 (+) Transcript_84902:77-697(+)